LLQTSWAVNVELHLIRPVVAVPFVMLDCPRGTAIMSSQIRRPTIVSGWLHLRIWTMTLRRMRFLDVSVSAWDLIGIIS
jgi:hypothetical protein